MTSTEDLKLTLPYFGDARLDLRGGAPDPEGVACPVRERGLELRSACDGCEGRPGAGQRILERHAVLYLEGDRGDSVFGVVEGYVRESRTLEDGRTLGIRLVRPGDLVGTEAFAFEPYQCTAETLTPARICRIPVPDVERTLLRTPAQGVLLSRALGREAIELRESMMMVGSMTAEERVRVVLERLLESTPRGKWTRLPLSRQEMAELLGLALGTVSRTVQRLAREGRFEVSGRMIRVPARIVT